MIDNQIVELFPPNLAQAATRQLRDEILSGALQPGERLIEKQVNQRFSISGSSARGAFRLLAQQGLVEHLPRRGTRVTAWSNQDIRQLFELRAVFELHAVQTAFPLPGADPLVEVRANPDRMRKVQDVDDALANDDAPIAISMRRSLPWPATGS